MSIEKKIKSLEILAEALESEDIDLNNALKKYEAAVKLSKTTLTELNALQEKVEILREESIEVLNL